MFDIWANNTYYMKGTIFNHFVPGEHVDRACINCHFIILS